ncbi:MAG: glycosyltransferase family 2 protein [Methylococcales bacterium]|nr:glycosyltransferase family 2 protein [Methylococcales bacterium]
MLSVIIITKNESHSISHCLNSVRFADEIIVLDSGSDDDTIELCRQFTDQVFSTDWPGFGLQKQRALDKAVGDWVLSIDADEVVSPALQREIKQAMQAVDIDGFEIPRLSRYCGKTIKHAGWYPDYVLRLFKREKGHFTEALVHERIIVEGTLSRLTEAFKHEAFINLDEVLHKVNTYSTLGARKLYQQGKRTSLMQAIFKGVWTFVRTYLLKAAFLDGQQGFMLAISNAEGTYYKHLKLLELQHTEGY